MVTFRPCTDISLPEPRLLARAAVQLRPDATYATVCGVTVCDLFRVSVVIAHCHLAKLGRRSRHGRVEFESPVTHDAPPPSRPWQRPAGPGRSPLAVLFTALFARNNTANRGGLPGCRTCRICGRGCGAVAARLQPEPRSARTKYASSGWGNAPLAICPRRVVARARNRRIHGQLAAVRSHAQATKRANTAVASAPPRRRN